MTFVAFGSLFNIWEISISRLPLQNVIKYRALFFEHWPLAQFSPITKKKKNILLSGDWTNDLMAVKPLSPPLGRLQTPLNLGHFRINQLDHQPDSDAPWPDNSWKAWLHSRSGIPEREPTNVKRVQNLATGAL